MSKSHPALLEIEVGSRVIDAHRQELTGKVFSEESGAYSPWWNAITIAAQPTLAGVLLALVDLEEA